MDQSQSAHNKRKFPRIDKKIPVEVNRLCYPLPLDPGESCVCKNISAGGVCFTISNSYEPGAVLSLKISIPGWQGYKKPFSFLVDIASESPLTAIGEVVWCRQHSESSDYEIGIKFLNIYEDDYRALIKYLEAQTAQASCDANL
ncbi:MAG: hypothetical protein BWK80_27345 [Desulfobacteraceae bacterium IS3]|nr:MAG: hypothetical protein BWK80_27345 [Desulfobacteraceae bacterium IS3]